MANTWKNLYDGRVLRQCIESFENKMQILKLVNHQYDSSFDEGGRASDGTIQIKLPLQFTVNEGANMNVRPIEQKTISFTRAIQRHVDFSWSSVEKCNEMDTAMADVFDPAMATLAQMVEYYILSNAYADVYQLVGTPNTDPATVAAISNARSRLTDMLCPDSDVNLLVTPTSMAKMSQSVYTYFHKDKEIENAFVKNYIGSSADCNWFTSTMIPKHTNGTRDDTTPVVNTSTGITSGTAVITMTAFGDGLTYKKGDIFTIDDVYAVNPITKQRQDFLQQFVVTADETETGAGDMSPAVSPTPITSGDYQNVELVSAGAGKLVNNLDTGGSGAASLISAQNLMFHKSAIAVAFAKLPNPDGGTWSSKTIDNISMRIWKQSDIRSDTHDTRIDVLFGYKVVRPEFAVRVRG